MPSRKQNHITLPFKNEQELRKYLEHSVTESLKQLIRVTVNLMIKEEMKTFREQLTQEMKAELGVLQFNGSYSRNLKSPLGMIRDIPIPRFRYNQANYTPSSLAIFANQEEEFLRLIREMHRLGISQRKISHLAQTCFGIKLSPNRVGYVHRLLAEKEELMINSKTITDQYKYLYCDGFWVKSKGYCWETNQAVMLCVLGVTHDNQREILGFTIARSESYADWHQLLLNLKKRGLTGHQLQLIISDGAEGLIKAVKHLFPQIPHQTCIVHKMRNVIGACSSQHKTALATDLKKIYQQTTMKQALLQAKTFAKKWYLTEPEAVNRLKYNFQSTLTYYHLPQSEWKQTRTNNILEREFRELRRRIKVMDSSFNDLDSATRYAASTFAYLNQNYPSQQRRLHTKS